MSIESVAEFRARAKAWLAANMPRVDVASPPVLERDSIALWQRAREIQGRLYDGGFAGICFPSEYGGLGLDYEYKKAFDAEAVGYEMPVVLNVPCFAICCATIHDMGSEEQKRTHIAAALRGDEVLVQLLSEPNGGSDLAGVTTRAERRGDRWVVNGAKTWSTGAFAADFGLCLARIDWEVPKHDGLTMFLMPLRAPGPTMNRIRQVDGTAEFCEEFFDDVELGDDAVVGEPGRGWEVASCQLYDERRTMGDGSEFTSGAGILAAADVQIDLLRLVERAAGPATPVFARSPVGRWCTAWSRSRRVSMSTEQCWTADCLPRQGRSSGRSWQKPTTSKPMPPRRLRAQARSSRRNLSYSPLVIDISADRSPISAAARRRWHATSSVSGY